MFSHLIVAINESAHGNQATGAAEWPRYTRPVPKRTVKSRYPDNNLLTRANLHSIVVADQPKRHICLQFSFVLAFSLSAPADDAFIVALSEDDHNNDVALDIISRNPLYADLRDSHELIMNLRQIANYAFLNEEFEEALQLYDMAIEMTKNLPILFNSRALCYIR